MRIKSNLLHSLILLLTQLPTLAAWDSPYVFQSKRNPVQWPFADTSIWNLAIHKNAKYVPANIIRDSAITVDEDLLFLHLTPQWWIWLRPLAVGIQKKYAAKLPRIKFITRFPFPMIL